LKLWLVERIGGCGYDEHIGFVVRADDADAARCEALVAAGIDDYEWLDVDQVGCREPWWGDPELTTCVEITADGQSGVILDSFKAG
jgi:hypothetical protein